jgi:GntR family transcriptional regulator
MWRTSAPLPPTLYAREVPIDRSEVTSFSAQIADDLRRRIHAGEFATDNRLPSLRALATEYEVAEMTAHAAVRQLQSEGLLAAASGRGTFVRRSAELTSDSAPLPEQLDALRREVAELRVRLDRLEESHERSADISTPSTDS